MCGDHSSARSTMHATLSPRVRLLLGTLDGAMSPPVSVLGARGDASLMHQSIDPICVQCSAVATLRSLCSCLSTDDDDKLIVSVCCTVRDTVALWLLPVELVQSCVPHRCVLGPPLAYSTVAWSGPSQGERDTCDSSLSCVSSGCRTRATLWKMLVAIVTKHTNRALDLSRYVCV